MPKTIRRLATGSTALLAVFLYAPPAAAMQAAAVPDTAQLLRMAHDELLTCGQMAVQAGKAPAPQTLKDAKSVLGVNCMTEFNLLMELADATSGRRSTAEDANRQFDFAATLIVVPAGPNPEAAAKDGPANAGHATTAERTAPESCKGSVKKGLKAYNAGSFETALCHWLPKARAGDAAAQNNIGLLFERGLSVHTPQSDEEAAAWFNLAAQQGLTMAMRNLAGAQARLGRDEAARSWIELADATD